MEKLDQTAELQGELKIERPYSLPGILLGTSSTDAILRARSAKDEKSQEKNEK
jgi:hypothetical protein